MANEISSNGMYNYKNAFTSFLIQQKLVTINEGNWRLAYIGPKELEATVAGMNEYLGEAVDMQELYSEAMPELYKRWHETFSINEKLPMEEQEKLEAEHDHIDKQMWHQTRASYEDLILFLVASRIKS